MAILLNNSAYQNAVNIIKKGLEVEHDSGNWDEVKATSDEEVRFLNHHDLDEYGLWFLGIDTDADPEDRSKYVYPCGDFSVIHKSALMVAVREAGENKDLEIKKAAEELLKLIEKSKK